MNDVGQKFKAIVATQLGAPEGSVSDAATLADLGGDGLDLIEIIMAAEEEFEVELMDADLAEAATVGDIIVLLEREISADPCP